jgi:hypothetical protein
MTIIRVMAITCQNGLLAGIPPLLSLPGAVSDKLHRLGPQLMAMAGSLPNYFPAGTASPQSQSLLLIGAAITLPLIHSYAVFSY